MISIIPIIFYILIFINFLIAFFYFITFLKSDKEEKSMIKRFPKITFIIPAFNVEKYIEDTIISVFDSDYPSKKIKIIVINDGSTDNTLNIIKKIMKRDRRISLINKKNEGKAIAINTALGKVKTEITAVLDADTILEKELLKKMLYKIEKGNVMAVTCRIDLLNEKRNFFGRMQKIEYAFTSFFRKILSSMQSMATAPAFTIFKTEFFKKYGGYDKKNLTEDFEIGLRIQKKGYDVEYVISSEVKTVVPQNFSQLKKQRVRWGYGTIYNLIKYKELFGFRHGNLGFFFLPAVLFGILSLLLVLVLSTYMIISSVSNYLSIIQLAGFYPNINIFKATLILGDSKIILGTIGLLFSISFFFMIKKETSERLKFFDYIIYIFGYVWFLAYFYLLSILAFFTKKPSWS